MLLNNLGLMLPKFLKQIFILHISIIVPGRGLSEVVETGRGRRNTGGEVNLDLANTLLTRRRMRRSTVSDEEEEYGDYADYDAEQDYSASNTSYEDTPEVTILSPPGALVVNLFREFPFDHPVLTEI